MTTPAGHKHHHRRHHIWAAFKPTRPFFDDDQLMRSDSGVLQNGPVDPWLAEALRDRYGTPVLPLHGPSRLTAVARHSDAIALVTAGNVGADAILMDALPQLGAIVSSGVGYDLIDLAAARRRGIQVSNTPDVVTDCVADLAVGLVIDAMRGISAADRYLRAGHWAEQPFRLTQRVTGSRVGILGLGRIGRAIAARLESFSCSISYHNRRRVPDVRYRHRESVLALAADVDVLVVAAGGGPETRNLVDREVLQALGPTGFLVNVGRGSIVDEEALVSVLSSRGLGGAALDVFAAEPHPTAGLLQLENVVLLPHIGSGTRQTRQAMADLVLDNLASFLREGRLITPVEA
jgi:lactate dehydrogenase-like 2-hydroxyacid dehydrogenase